MNPTPEQIQKLPKWAQDHIAFLDRRASEATKKVSDFLADQKPSAICVPEFTAGLNSVRYIQASTVRFIHRGVELEVTIRDSNLSGTGIQLQWGEAGTSHSGEVAFIPETHQRARLISKEDMR